MTLRRFNSIAAILLGLVCSVGSALPGDSELLYGAVVFIASPAGSNMGGLLASQIAKNKVPLTISSERPYASYILAAFAEPTTGPMPAAPVAGRTDHGGTIWNSEAVLADAQTHAIAWSAEFHGPCQPCDAAPGKAEQIMAARFVKRLKHDLFSRESVSDRIDDFLAP
jgi:hypothetical protein